MKIAHAVMMFQTGGIETMLVDIINQQVKDGHKVDLVIFNDDIRNDALLSTIHSNVKIHFVNRPVGSKNPYYLLKFNLILAKIAPDIIHAHNLAFAQLIYAKSLKRVFITDHNWGHDYSKYPRLNKINKIFAISHRVESDVIRRHGRVYENLVVVENGIDTHSIKKHSFIERGNKSFNIVMVSRLSLIQKSQDVLIQAVSLLPENYYVHLDFIGTGDDENQLNNLAVSLGLTGKISFLGNKSRKELYQLLCNYDLLVQSSKIEGFGLTVAEGMAAGLPVLVSDNGGPMEIIDNGKYGFYFKTGDAEDCASKIMSIMDMTDSQYQDICQKSIARSKKYSLDKMMNKYYDYYENVFDSTK